MQHETGFGFVRLLRGVFPPACSVGGWEVDRVGGGQTARAVIALCPVGDIHALDAHDRAGARRMDKLAGAQVHAERKNVVYGKRVSERVDLGGRRIIKKKKRNK